ncbi:uncharacterized protein F5Z01DRAFT_669104 [Emericellopsis atlantica]|uniref:2EXR domain-containing protein n=1 Tax=Emericellopsis atlantica TaxID=2614577 RepID=A0A9P8CK23_9HYPO|nr:uncharacterized protein F5Z01DRAFT_669104 [Emericellopsis atlantica]KAG9249495.1 hypothetical protein F5Z01DRAFT_669104 [Emericellopsis atlantica]
MGKRPKRPPPVVIKKRDRFHQFSRLPPEIRTRVWELTEAEPRIVEVYTHPPTIVFKQIEYIRSPVRPPAVLHVCREARRCALARSLYVRAFTSGSKPRDTWVNFEFDMISVRPITFEPIKPEKPLIQRLRIQGSRNENWCYWRSNEMATDFPSIKEVHVICTDGVVWWRDAIDDDDFGTQNVKFFNETPSGYMLTWKELEEKYPSSYSYIEYDDESKSS